MAYAYVTGDLITPDGSNVWVHGEETEPGHGATLESGWVSPSWSTFTVFENREDVERFTFDPDDDETVPEWQARLVSEILGSAHDNGDGTFYGAESQTRLETGEDISLALHFYDDGDDV